MSEWLPLIKDFVDTFSKLFTVFATVVVGWWAFYRFVKGRVFKPRGMIRMWSRRFREQSVDYVVVAIEFSNLGLTKIDIEEATIRAFLLLPGDDAKTKGKLKAVRLTTLEIFQEQSWVEPGVPVYEEKIIPCPLGSEVAIRIHGKIVISGKLFKVFRFVDRRTSHSTTIISEAQDTEASSANR